MKYKKTKLLIIKKTKNKKTKLEKIKNKIEIIKNKNKILSKEYFY